MRSWMIPLVLLSCTGCGAVIEPGHRGLLFKPYGGGLQHKVLNPGHHWIGPYDRVEDYDVTYSTHAEEVHSISSEGLTLALRISIIYRPVVSELYDLATEVGADYYDEVVGPEFRTAIRGVFAHHSYLEPQRSNTKIEDEIRTEVRRRVAGKHIEVSSVTMERMVYAPEIEQAIRAKLAGEQEAARQRALLENDAMRTKLELQNAAERAKMEAQNQLDRKQNERAIAQEQAAIDKIKVASAAETEVAAAKATAEKLTLLAHAHAEEKRAEAVALTPLVVMMHGFDALAKLGGSGTNLLLGDWSKVPSFLFPPNLLRGLVAGDSAATAPASKVH